MASEEKVTIVYRERPSTGAAMALVSMAFSLVAIFTPLATLSLPFALILAVAAFVKGAISLSFVGLCTSILAGFFLVMGYVTSPIALAIHLAFLGRLVGGNL